MKKRKKTKKSPARPRLSPEMRLDYLWREPETGTRESHRACVCALVVSFYNVFGSMHNLPDVVLCLIFSYLTAFERICKVGRVCRRWHSLIKSSSQVWNCVDFAWQRKIRYLITFLTE